MVLESLAFAKVLHRQLVVYLNSTKVARLPHLYSLLLPLYFWVTSPSGYDSLPLLRAPLGTKKESRVTCKKRWMAPLSSISLLVRKKGRFFLLLTQFPFKDLTLQRCPGKWNSPRTKIVFRRKSSALYSTSSSRRLSQWDKTLLLCSSTWRGGNWAR